MSMETMTQEEFLKEAERRFGPKVRDWKFVCPACGSVMSVQQYLDAGLSREEVHSVIGYSCIGRYTGQRDQGIAAKNKGLPWNEGCNWTLGGLLWIHELEVILPNGQRRPTFKLAEAA